MKMARLHTVIHVIVKHTGLINVDLLHGLHTVVTFSINLEMKCKTLLNSLKQV